MTADCPYYHLTIDEQINHLSNHYNLEVIAKVRELTTEFKADIVTINDTTVVMTSKSNVSTIIRMLPTSLFGSGFEE